MGKQVVLVTGASAGIGRATAIRLARAGHTVFAAGRRPDRLAELGLETVPLDVTDESQVLAARERISESTGGHGLDAVINSAGFSAAGPLELLTTTDLRAQFEVNVFGLLSVVRAFVPAMRTRRRGRIINVGSLMGRLTMPLLGAYNASKHAVRAVNDALRMELAPFGISVVLIEPAAIRTEFHDRKLVDLRRLQGLESPYRRALERAAASLAAVPRYPEPELVARVIERALTRPRPRTRYVVPRRHGMAVGLLTALPAPLRDAILGRELHRVTVR